MNANPARHVLCSLLLLPFASAVCARAQTPDLPAAPASAPARPNFTLPRSSTSIVADSANRSVPAAPVEPDECYAPATGLYAPRPKLSPALEDARKRYMSLAVQNLYVTWFDRMPRRANDPWLKGARTVVRFAILPDGSTDTPRITSSSGRESYDHHALDAIRNLTPFPPLPEGLEPNLILCVYFRYNMEQDAPWKPDALTPPTPAKSTP